MTEYVLNPLLEEYPDYLEHHGVPGQKWGVRKSRKSLAAMVRPKNLRGVMTNPRRKKKSQGEKNTEKVKAIRRSLRARPTTYKLTSKAAEEYASTNAAYKRLLERQKERERIINDRRR